jgi:hypothetical protein
MGGWGPRAWDQLAERLATLETALMGILGKTPEGDPKIGNIGLGTWLSIMGVIVVPIVVAIIALAATK